MPKVYNRHHKNVPKDAVYIGRGTPWGNPFSHLSLPGTEHVETRGDAVERFAELVEENTAFRQQIKTILKDKDLLCSCAPLPCHGDVLLKIANE